MMLGVVAGVGFFLRGTARADALTAFDEAAGQEDHHEHEHDAQRQVPALADERVDHGDHEVLEPVGQEGEPAVQDVVVDLGE
jgi:hypothetical protein